MKRSRLLLYFQLSLDYKYYFMPHVHAFAFHDDFAKTCALFDVATQALKCKNSTLVDDVVLMTTAVYGISRKYETEAATGQSEFLLRVAANFERQLGRQVTPRTVNEVNHAEFEIFEALDWTFPETNTYTCTTTILLRVLILTLAAGHAPDGLAVSLLKDAWATAVRKCVYAVMSGLATGYATAYIIVRDALEDVHFEKPFLELDGLCQCEGVPLLREAAPEPVEAHLLVSEWYMREINRSIGFI
jgi:hypothetical protein